MENIPDGARTAKLQVPEPMKRYSNFVMWKLVHKTGETKPTKLPFDAKTGQNASTTDPSSWADYQTVCRAFLAGGYDGIGFVFTSGDPFAFIDLDNCRDPVTGAWTQHAWTLMSHLRGVSWETSQSGTGLHGIAHVSNKAAFANKCRKWKDSDGNAVEFYTDRRYMAVGFGNWSLTDVPIDCDDGLSAWVPDRGVSSHTSLEWEDAALPDYAGPADDAELIRRASEKSSPYALLGRHASFAALWNGDADVLGNFFPDPSGSRQFDNSSAEQALANSLAWWTGCNRARIERLMNRAPLCRREKWHKRKDYRTRTIMVAVSVPNRSYIKTSERRDHQLQTDMAIGEDLPTPPLPNMMTLEEMLRDLVHVGFGSQIVHRGSKTIRSREDGASEYAASVTEIDTGKSDRDGKPIQRRTQTLELWRRSSFRISVDVVTWQPGQPEICRALDTAGSGQTAYNLYVAPRILPTPQNWQERAKIFEQHIEYLVPIEGERIRFMMWLAHIMQKPGELPHTCYLMIAKTTGIGRGTLSSILVRVFRGYVAANADVGMLVAKSYNGRISQKILATVDEIREGGSPRYQQQENFKSAVVEEERLINPKFGRQYVEKNCCRWLLFSNHHDAIPFDNSDRRVVVIENPIQPAHASWFEHLHKEIQDPQFIASVQYYLMTLDISAFKPGERAPMNAAKAKALASMESPADAAARQFAASWPGDLATVADLRAFIGDDVPSANRALGHVIDRAGMTSGHRQKVAGTMQTILVVRGVLTAAALREIPHQIIANMITGAQTQFRAIS